METLAIAIRQNPDIKGIAIGNEETKLLQYADDTTAILSDTDSAKTLFNTVYGKMTIIKSFLIPKFVHAFSILPTPKEVVNELNQLLFKFLLKGVDKVTRVSVIDEYMRVAA